ncbi:MAG: radical SAM protein [Dethiobacteria bacterium]
MRYEGKVFRPINEANSYILQCTIGCSHNRCTFCPMYKDEKFRIRSLQEIKADIRMAKSHYGDLKNVFLADGDAISMDTGLLLEILAELYAAFPSLKYVASYAGPDSTLNKSMSELTSLRAAGLNRAYLGVESGDDKVLSAVQKGVTAEEMFQAGRSLVNSGFDLFCIVQLGLGGRDRSQEHAASIVDIINRIQPGNLNILTYTPVPGTILYQQVQKGQFQVLDPFETLEEMKMILAGITIDDVIVTSYHISNYYPIKGVLPKDRERMINTSLTRKP